MIEIILIITIGISIDYLINWKILDLSIKINRYLIGDWIDKKNLEHLKG